MSISVSVHLREKPVAIVDSNTIIGHPDRGVIYWVEVDGVTIHCRSQAQAILLADAINLPDGAEASDTLASDMLAALKAMVLNDTHTYRDCHKAALSVIARAEGRGDDADPIENARAALSRSADAVAAAIHPEDGRPLDGTS
jgi:hypothetical protein